MHPHVVEACAMLHKQVARYQRYNHWLTERAEEALVELVGNPERTDPPPHQVRNALSNASKKLKRRHELMDEFSPTLTFGIDRPVLHLAAESIHDIESVVSRMSSEDRSLIEAAADESGAEELAEQLCVPVQRARERLSRARARARALWEGQS